MVRSHPLEQGLRRLDNLKVAVKVHKDGAFAVLPRQNTESTAVNHHLRRGPHTTPHLVKLLVEVNAKRLESQLGRVHRLVFLTLGGSHERRESLGRRRKPILRHGEAHRVGDPPRRDRVRALAVFVQNPDQLVAVHPREKLRRGYAPSDVEPEVQGSVLLRPESPTLVVELRGGYAEVEKDPGARHAEGFEHRVHATKRGVVDGEPGILRLELLGLLNSLRVHIERVQPTVRAERGEYTARVTAPSEGAVHVRSVWIGLHQRVNRLPQHCGGVRAESLLRGPHAERPRLGDRDAEVTPPELYAVLGQRSLPGVLVRESDKPGTLALARGGVADEPDAAQDLPKLREEVRNLVLLARVRQVLDEHLVPVSV
mmetsp:Transcript_5792/g.23950  ORF Transcript_5792/g.23950 Transcript_5792/m.23950 type:complete len:370 (-) Transcript_5792:727-1836(-)